MTEIVKIDAKEFGIEETKAQQIADQFKPMLDKMVELEKEFNEVAKLDPSKETSAKAKELRLKYVKVRTGTAEIHKQQKAFYLNAGRFVDGWKNAQIFASEGVEQKLQEIETHFERMEAERTEAIRLERWGKLSAYLEIEPYGLGKMEDVVFDNLLSGTKAAHDAKVAAEKQAEADRIAKEKAEAEERERIRLENERLRKEAEAKEAQLKAEREAAEKALQSEREKAEKARKEAEEKSRIEREKAEAERKSIEEKARIEREKLQAELAAKEAKEKAECEAKEAQEKARIAAENQAKKAPDKDKLNALASSFEAVSLPALSTPEALESLKNIRDLQRKLVNYIREKAGAI